MTKTEWKNYPVCPRCGAKPGFPCHGLNGAINSRHLERAQKGSYLARHSVVYVSPKTKGSAE